MSLALIPYSSPPSIEKIAFDAFQFCKRNPEVYSRCLKNLNEKTERAVKASFSFLSDSFNEKNFCITITGSDARYEKESKHSPVELIIVCEGEIDLPSYQNIQNFILSHPNIFDARIEVKNLENPHASTTYSQGKKPKIIPSRALDAIFVAGNPQIFALYKKHLATSLRSLKNKDFKKFSRDFLSDAKRKLLQTLQGKEKKYCDFTKGVLFYNKNLHIMTTKYILLRVVQYTIAQQISQKIRSGSWENPEELLTALPNGTVDRLIFLKERELISLKEGKLQEIAWAYNFALMLHNITQWQSCSMGGAPGQIQIDPEDLQKMCAIILNFSENASIWER